MYKELSNKEAKQIKNYLQIIYNAVQFIDKEFKNYLIAYYTSNDCLTLKFTESNFMHLCGIKYSDGAKSFYRVCKKKCLDIKKIKVKIDGTTMQKLQVLSSINDLLTPNVRLTGKFLYLNMSFSKSLRTRKQLLALSLNLDSFGSYYYPESLLNLKKLTHFPIGEEIIKIERISFQGNVETIYQAE